MADYYPLIARAVANLPQNTDAARSSLYERAHSALAAQLHNYNEPEVTRERQALDEAIRKVEMEANNKRHHTTQQPERLSHMKRVACFFGVHKWNGCKCSRCGAIRNEGHDWDGAKCRLCGKPSPEEEARFLTAITNGDSDDVITRLQANHRLAHVNDVHGNTPLHLAVNYGHLPVARFLVRNNGNVGAMNLQGNTPLHVAAEKDHAPLAQLLLEYGAEVRARNQQSDTPLLVAARHDSELVGRSFVEAARDVALAELKKEELKKATDQLEGGVPSNWDGDRIVREALDVAKSSGSYKIAACLHRANASFHKAKGDLYTARANAFVRMHNKRVAERGQAYNGLFGGFATEVAQEAKKEYDMAREQDRAADTAITLSAAGPTKSATRPSSSAPSPARTKLPPDPEMDHMEAMMNAQAWVWQAELDNSMQFIFQGGRITGIWLAAFPTNAPRRTLLNLFCQNQKGRDSKINDAIIEAVVDRIYDDRYVIQPNSAKGGFDVLLR